MTEKLISFMEGKIADLKSGKLSEEETRLLSEYFLVDNYMKNCTETTEKDMMKYIVTGYYVYQNLNEKNCQEKEQKNVAGC
jgi:hypothetical protein